MAVTFLNKLYVKVIFSDASELNLTAYDMGEEMCSVQIDNEDDIVARLRTATGTVASLGLIAGVSGEVSIVKTSTAYQEWLNRILSNSWIGGTCTLYDDTNTAYTMSDISIAISELPATNGTEAAVKFKVKGNLQVNKEILNL